jgi:hypothetical protein
MDGRVEASWRRELEAEAEEEEEEEEEEGEEGLDGCCARTAGDGCGGCGAAADGFTTADDRLYLLFWCCWFGRFCCAEKPRRTDATRMTVFRLLLRSVLAGVAAC